MARVQLKMTGIRQVLRSRGVQSQVSRVAKAIADDAGEGFEMQTKQHKYTSRAFAQTEEGNTAAKERQARDHVLEQAVGKRR